MNKNKVFIACSLDGYIADRNGGIDWLNSVPNPDQEDLGYMPFMESVNALLMGRLTFEKVLSFGIPWPYDKPVFVWSSKLNEIPVELYGKVELVKGKPAELIRKLNDKGYRQIYIDGGRTIQTFLEEDLIDELTISRIPVLLGDGFPLFGELPAMLHFTLVRSEVFLGQIVQDTYIRKR